MVPIALSLTYMKVISLDRCYALCRPLSYRAKVTKRGKTSFFACYQFRVNFGLFQSTDRVGGGEERDR